MISRRRASAGLLVLILAISIVPGNRSAVGRASPNLPRTTLDEGYVGNPTAEFRTDTDGDGLFDSLVLRVPFIVNVSGRFWLSASLFVNNTQAGNTTDRNLAPGTYLIEMALPGWRIRLSRSDGPYNVSLGMYDPDTSFSAGRSYRTAAYDWTTFEFLVELQGGLSETAVDANGDGLYNYLVVRGVLNVKQPDNYTLSATLSERGSSFIVGYAYNRSHWAAGVWQFLLRFSGDSIRTYGVNGPYTIGIQLAQDYFDVLQRESFDTAAYLSTQFYHKPILFHGNLTDHGVDFDGNGLFDVLRIEIPVAVTVAGLYDIYGRLSDPYCIGCDITASRRVELSPVDSNTSLDFDALLFLNSPRGQNTILDLSIAEDVTVYYIQASGVTHSYANSEFDNPYADWVNGLRVTTPDHNGDGLFDELRINGTVLVKRGATLYIQFAASLGYCGYLCYLEDDISVVADPGQISVEASFPGWLIRAARSNGTYLLSASLRTGPYFLQSTSANATFTYDQFSPPLELRGPITYRMVDNDGDGLANQLLATVPLRIFQPGPYTFTAAVYNASSYVAVYSERQRYLAAGDVDVDFSFSGILLRELGANASLYFSTSLPWGFSTLDVLTLRIPYLGLDPSTFQITPMKTVTFAANPPPTNICCGYLRLVNYSNALILDLRLDSQGHATATIPDLSYVGAAVIQGSYAAYSWIGRLPSPLPANVLLNVSRPRAYLGDFLDVDLLDWFSGHAWLNRSVVGNPFTRFNADLTYDPDGTLTSDEIQNAFQFLWLGAGLAVNLRSDNATIPVSRNGPDVGIGEGPVESGDPITLATPWSLALPGVESSSHTVVVNLTGGNPYYTPSARVRVPPGWNVTNVATASGVVVSGVGTRDVRIVVTENRTFPSDAVLTVHPTSPTPPRGQISGRVLGALGAPLTGAHVAAALGGVEVANVTTGSDGVFTFPALGAGTYEIYVSAAGYASRTLAVGLSEDETLGLGDIPLTALSSGSGVVLGRIRDESGAAIGNMSVGLFAGSTATAQTRSASDGSFEFDGVPAGSYIVRVTAPGFVTQEVSVKVIAWQTSDLGQIVLARSSQPGTFEPWLIPAVAGIGIGAVTAAGVLLARRTRSRSKPPKNS